ncbi:putative invertase inhibitor [Zea mays]|uniref:Putative invertase inhibitor n=1 Tax=Zea mays TaxID=4577 RepID=A0A3L6FSL0_MAIZE|nr:putative invertase inhibitor [Zea mays]
MKLLQALCPLVILLACSTSNASVLQDACKSFAAKIPDTGYSYCIKFFQADRGSAGADKRGLAAIAVRIMGAAAKSTASHIAALRASEKDKERLACLSDCSEVYAQAVDQTGVAAKGIASGTPRGRADAVTALSTVEDAPGTCEQGFQDLGLRSPLASEDARFRKDASIALSVTAAL